MVLAFAAQLRAAGTYSSPAVAVTKLGTHDVQIVGTGLSAADLADPALSLTQVVQANDAASGNAQGWYSIYGPDVWSGGGTSHIDGSAIQPGFAFHNDAIPDSAVRLRLQVTSNRDAMWGYTATVV